MAESVDSMLKQYITDEVAEMLPRAVAEQIGKVKPPPLWMTETQLAEYWSIYGNDGRPTTAGIRSWANRPADEHPLPYANMGEMRRYHRETADKWALEEVSYQRSRLSRRRMKLVNDSEKEAMTVTSRTR